MTHNDPHCKRCPTQFIQTCFFLKPRCCQGKGKGKGFLWGPWSFGWTLGSSKFCRLQPHLKSTYFCTILYFPQPRWNAKGHLPALFALCVVTVAVALLGHTCD